MRTSTTRSLRMFTRLLILASLVLSTSVFAKFYAPNPYQRECPGVNIISYDNGKSMIITTSDRVRYHLDFITERRFYDSLQTVFGSDRVEAVYDDAAHWNGQTFVAQWSIIFTDRNDLHCDYK